MTKSSTLAFGALIACVAARGADLSPLAVEWINSQARIRAWSASFVQTRTLPSLVQPLTATGQVHFLAPGRFRWELGQPPQTIAVRATNDLWLVYPRLKRAERYALDAAAQSSWQAALQLLEAGFPRGQAEVQAQYVVLSESQTNGTSQLVLQPRANSARKVISKIRVEFNASNLQLRATEFEFADGSRMRNDFAGQTLNPDLDEALFVPDIPPDFKIVTPANRSKHP